jgi:hypothetical protein
MATRHRKDKYKVLDKFKTFTPNSKIEYRKLMVCFSKYDLSAKILNDNKKIGYLSSINQELNKFTGYPVLNFINDWRLDKKEYNELIKMVRAWCKLFKKQSEKWDNLLPPIPMKGCGYYSICEIHNK